MVMVWVTDALNITDGASKLDNAHVRLFARTVDWDLGDSQNPVLDSVGHMRYPDRVS